ncbi:MAG: hypothetical protein BJ554DRAFT_7836 [Olpidium bornovanus]|uniref:Uncharacterized protein n=1 Tax=Olpidium bornovanus TaxID=278681 RepID=A0A8H7ZVS0_9FUNG|nr:MAG: hypothetical protein BJ554DRAFT_7836 [Olpidium bornovanus]
MATRSRTILFLQYRNSFGRAGPKPLPGAGGPGAEAGTAFRSSSERAGLIANAVAQDTIIEMSSLPPKWWVTKSTETELYSTAARRWLRVDVVDEVRQPRKTGPLVVADIQTAVVL